MYKHKAFLTLIVFSLSVAALVGVISTTHAANEAVNITIAGQVGHEESNTLLAGVTIRLTGPVSRTILTDANGQYSFGSVPAGQYNLSASKAGYQLYPPAVNGDMFSDQWREFTASGPMPNPMPTATPGAPTLSWVSYFDTAQSFNDVNPVMTVDAQGNVLVSAMSFNEQSRYGDSDIVTMKYDRNGTRLWTRRFTGAEPAQDMPTDIRTDTQGNVYVTGGVWSGVEPDFDIVTIKYDASGNEVWSRLFNGTADYQDFGHALRLDAAGNVYVAGYSISNNNGRIDNNFITLKYDNNGVQQWVRYFDGGMSDGAEELELDASGNIYVTGTSIVIVNGGSTSDIITVKYNAAGVEQWVNRYDSHSLTDDTAYRLEIDTSGNAYVMGRIWTRARPEVVLIKINGSTGANTWTRNWSRSNGQQDDLGLSLTLDANNNAIISGQTYYGPADQNVDVFTVKYDPAGTLLWQKIFNGPSTSGFDGDCQVKTDGAGNVFVGMSSQGFNNYDLTLAKYSPDGTLSYTYRFDNDGHKDDLFWGWENNPRGSALTVGADGAIYMAGDSSRISPVTGALQIDTAAVKLTTTGPTSTPTPATTPTPVPTITPSPSPSPTATPVPTPTQTPVATPSPSPTPTPPSGPTKFDYDGDGRADVSVFRPSDGNWYLQRSLDGFAAVSWGVASDKITPADYDHDGKTDIAVFRPSDGNWYILQSSNGTLIATNFGTVGDMPVTADFDGDGRSDMAVYRPSTATWWINRSTGRVLSAQFGAEGDIPVAADYNGDGKAELAVIRPANGTWYYSSDFVSPAQNFTAQQWGLSSDKAVPADYDGDGKTDIAVYRPSNGSWYVRRSSNGVLEAKQFGNSTDIPVPADYDGDGKADAAVFRSAEGTWWIDRSTSGITAAAFGLNGDIPTPAAGN